MKSIGGAVERIRDLMRRDAGVDGDAQRLAQLSWLLFLKVCDERATEVPDAFPPHLRWRSWVSGSEVTGDELLAFVDDELLPGVRRLPGDGLAAVAREVFAGVSNVMRSGSLLRQVVSELDRVTLSPGEHEIGDVYERVLADLQNAGNAGEFYTPRALTRFMVACIDPRAGETVLDPACGTGGFLTAAHEHAPSLHLRGVEKKPLPHLLAVTNLLLHGVRSLALERGDALAPSSFASGGDELVDVLLSNPPFGGVEEDGGEPSSAKLRSRDTAERFVLLAMERLAPGGRAGLVLPDGFLFGTGSKARLKKKLLEEHDLHTIVRLPKGVFLPYTAIKTNLLFFTKGRPTRDVWFYEHHHERGRRYSRTRPLTLAELEPARAWWSDRAESSCAWKVSADELVARGHDLDVKNPRHPQSSVAAEAADDLSILLAAYEEARDRTAALHQRLQEELRAALHRGRS